jgi:UDP-N-acetyl-D-glucosamine dehydrogenase
MSETLYNKLTRREARVGVIGLGYVGLPLGVAFAQAGFEVVGLDVDTSRVEQLNQGASYIQDVSGEELAQLVKTGKFRATTDYAVLRELDAVSICVPTPLNKLRDPDISFIVAVMDRLVPHVHRDFLVVLESTTYPGTTRELVLPRLEETDYTIGKDLFLCFSPERIDPGNPQYKIPNTPKVLGGVTEACTRIGRALYEQIIESLVPVSSPEAAEMVKLLENTFRSINIGLANEVAIMCEKLGVDVWEVIRAAATKPFGFMPFTPGPGLGGHCIPVDPHYLAWKMKTLDYKARFIELAGEINTAMPFHVVELVGKGLNRRRKAINGSRILVLGAAYKKDIDDVRESPALDVIRLLEESGAQVAYYDPHVPVIHWDGDALRGLPELTPEAVRRQDAVVIVTDHTAVDYELVKANADLIIDTRNVFPGNRDEHIIRLGVGN